MNNKEQSSPANQAPKLVRWGGKRFALINPPGCLGLKIGMGFRLQIPELESRKPELKKIAKRNQANLFLNEMETFIMKPYAYQT
jgi:hypothetical protein